MDLTPKQRDLLDVFLKYNNILAYGGARSGKTAGIIYILVYCCLQFPNLRCLVTRLYATDIRAAVWNDTLLKVCRLLDLRLGKEFKTNEQQMTLEFSNGSQIICAGLDDKERVDKILGTEYGIIYINESQDVPWTTVKVVKTRLAQRIDGFKNRFFADLNPTSINHWTYKLWFEGVMPDDESKKPGGSYGKIQMNPVDNMKNLADGFIDELENLTGEERKRFLLGEYSNQSDLQVFVPKSVHEDIDADFKAWAQGRWKDVKITGYLDLGFEDADAFGILGYIDGESDIWLIHEYKGVKNSITELGGYIKHGMAFVHDSYPIRESVWERDFDIWTDTGGLGRKTAQELADNLELPIRAAYKRDKDVGLFFVQDDVNSGRLHIQKDGSFDDECRKTVWTRDKETGKVLKIIDDDAFHPDTLDGIIYAYRFLMKNGNEAMMGRTVESIKEKPAENYWDIVAATCASDPEMEALNKMQEMLAPEGAW